MICVLYGGPHGHEHYRCDTSDFTPPSAVRVRTKPRYVSVYRYASMQGGSARFVYEDTLPAARFDMDWLVDFQFNR